MRLPARLVALAALTPVCLLGLFSPAATAGPIRNAVAAIAEHRAQKRAERQAGCVDPVAAPACRSCQSCQSAPATVVVSAPGCGLSVPTVGPGGCPAGVCPAADAARPAAVPPPAAVVPARPPLELPGRVFVKDGPAAGSAVLPLAAFGPARTECPNGKCPYAR